MITKWDKQVYATKARQAVAEGFVLLRNENNALPLQDGQKIAVFGRNQFNYYKSGTGSGGAVNTDYVVNVYDALEKSGKYLIDKNVRSEYEKWVSEHPYDCGGGWSQEPWFQEEMPLSQSFVNSAASTSDVAIICIGRTSGEDRDNLYKKGSYLLTDCEEEMLSRVCHAFSRTIVLLNVGNIIDMQWVEKFKPSAVGYIWQGGQEGGNGVLDVLSGEVNPSGHLSDTIAVSLNDYSSTENYGDEIQNIYKEDIYVGYRYFETFAKDRVIYPFGFGLSYTTFDMLVTKFDADDKKISLGITVTNTGKTAGKQVVQVYCEMPQGLLGKPRRVLCGFAKTDIIDAGKNQSIKIEIPMYALCSYDDSGITGNKSCYILEAGTYSFFVGENVRTTNFAGAFDEKETIVLQQCKEELASITEFTRIKPGAEKTDGDYEQTSEPVPQLTVLQQEKRKSHLPKEYSYTGDKNIRLADVKNGQAKMEDFVAQISNESLCCIVRGEGMSSPKVTPGIAGAFGGINEELSGLGIPVAGCADGPSGIRMDCGLHAFSLPNATCLACSFNEKLSEELYECEGLELRKNKIDALLGPGMNIHRDPLNGRNFEYFSEDPYLTGKMAAAQLRGMHKYNVTGTIKHFACNTQEFKRTSVDSAVSERAVREIYLKGFEIAVKEGKARAIMSTYGPINGIWTAGNYDLLTEILRNEWGFTGIVMTDWWAPANNAAGEPAKITNVAAQIRA